MAEHLLQKNPAVLFGGVDLRAGEAKCMEFWKKFELYQPSHAVFKHHAEHLHTTIPICVHGDKGRSLKKSPIACYSWESVWGLPDDLRYTPDEKLVKKRVDQKHDTGRLGQSCCERPAWSEGPEASSKCTIKRRRLGRHAEEKTQTHNNLGPLGDYHIKHFFLLVKYLDHQTTNIEYIIMTAWFIITSTCGVQKPPKNRVDVWVFFGTKDHGHLLSTNQIKLSC